MSQSTVKASVAQRQPGQMAHWESESAADSCGPRRHLQQSVLGRRRVKNALLDTSVPLHLAALRIG